MSRTNPYKKKRRSSQKTLLIYCEGYGEEVFLKYLRFLYARNSGVSVIVRNGKGGNPKSIVINACKELGDFAHRIVFVDNDKQEIKQAHDEAKNRGIHILENSPCLEATFLSILCPKQNFSTKKSAWCKKEFESKYIDKKKRMELTEYAKIFPKHVLDKQKDNVPVLKPLIDLMQGNNGFPPKFSK